MKTIILEILKPKTIDHDIDKWISVCARISNAANKSPGVHVFGENVWLFEFPRNLSFLSLIVQGMQQYGLKGKIAILEDEIVWSEIELPA